ncbi:hypothetical protein EJ03DRAFT_329120 [Teratosphaeria nubilosa]|uniref:Uncharacterized protein n=1 Tax=Teratosphaeria nubilosa TaxID=161662 RepID=A0A6G1L4H9_9PEZI|nr:hypothetical protein EJ03DRAFT_329120 [Teratosphaeria nubilosa]
MRFLHILVALCVACAWAKEKYHFHFNSETQQVDMVFYARGSDDSIYEIHARATWPLTDNHPTVNIDYITVSWDGRTADYTHQRSVGTRWSQRQTSSFFRGFNFQDTLSFDIIDAQVFESRDPRNRSHYTASVGPVWDWTTDLGNNGRTFILSNPTDGARAVRGGTCINPRYRMCCIGGC